MHIKLDKETKFTIGDTIYYWKWTANDGKMLVSDVVICIEVRCTEHNMNIAYMTQKGDIVYDFAAFSSKEECRSKA
jgi:hypothetical protein